MVVHVVDSSEECLETEDTESANESVMEEEMERVVQIEDELEKMADKEEENDVNPIFSNTGALG